MYTDNWYTAVPLAESLLFEGTNLKCTVQGNQKYLPRGVKQKLLKGNSIAYCKEKLVCVGWQDKKHVILLSTEGSSKMITYNSKRNREHQCPEIVCNYNLHMGGVNLSDMRCYMFLDEHRTIRWSKKGFFILLGRVLLHSFILYQCNTENAPKLNRRQFMVKLVEGLTGDFRAGQTTPGRKSVQNPPDRLLYPEKHLKQTKLPIGKKRNCVVCTDLKKGKRVRTSFICEHCNVALCLGQCWENYHTKKVL